MESLSIKCNELRKLKDKKCKSPVGYSRPNHLPKGSCKSCLQKIVQISEEFIKKSLENLFYKNRKAALTSFIEAEADYLS